MKHTEYTVQYFAGKNGVNQIIYRTQIKWCETEKDKLLDEVKAQYEEHPHVSKTATIMAYITKGTKHVAMCEITNRSRKVKPCPQRRGKPKKRKERTLNELHLFCGIGGGLLASQLLCAATAWTILYRNINEEIR